jgi:hypothetical protein
VLERLDGFNHHTLNFSVEKWPAGLYWARIHTAGGVVWKKTVLTD